MRWAERYAETKLHIGRVHLLKVGLGKNSAVPWSRPSGSQEAILCVVRWVSDTCWGRFGECGSLDQTSTLRPCVPGSAFDWLKV